MLSEQEKLRRSKAAALRGMGHDPYPSGSFETSASAQEVLDHYRQDTSQFDKVVLCGRIMARRIMGAAAFATLQDKSGRIQLYLHRDTLCPEQDKADYDTVFKKLIDIGDIVRVEGTVFLTRTDTISVQVNALTLLSKALKPLPVVKETIVEGVARSHDTFSDPEQRYRQRYVDLILNGQTRSVFAHRARIIQTLRAFFDKMGCLEVETPSLQPIYGGATARPFTTYHNALDTTLYLRISNELYLKRLIVGGLEGVYEIGKSFRNEGMSRFHNPEFTMLEAYVAYRDHRWMMHQTEAMFEQVALDLWDSPRVKLGEHTLSFERPWKQYTMYEAIEAFTHVNVQGMDRETLYKKALELGVPVDASMGKGKLIDEIFGRCCEPHLIQPTFITDYPIETSPLAKRNPNNPALVERFEVICGGKELCNAFSELNDPEEQRSRFENQVKLRQQGDAEAMPLDEDYLRALSYGMPPTVGLGIGIDRLVMVMTGVASIQDVIFFPQMRPEKFT